MINKLKNQGVVFVAALFIMIICLLLGLIASRNSRNQISTSTDALDSLKGFYSADAGVEHFIARIKAKEVTPSSMTNEAFGDIDGDAQTDYWASINWTTGSITSDYMPTPDINVARQMNIDITNFTGAMQAGENISISAPAGGTIAGNVDAVGSIGSNLSLYNTTGYTVTSSAGLRIPEPNWTEYANSANFTNYYVKADCTTFGATPPDGNGVYYITGNCTINRSGGSFTMTGTLIVSGNLTLQQITGLTLTAANDLPAIIVTGDVIGTSLSGININGLIYAGNDINFTTFGLGSVINGALVADNRISFTNLPSITLTFNMNLKPPYFSGGGGGGGTMTTQVVRVTHWQGHP